MNTLKMTVVALLVLQFTWVAQSQAQGRSEQILAELETKPHMPGEVLIQYRHGTTKEQKTAARARAGGKFADWVTSEEWRWDAKGDMELVRLPPGISIAAAVRQIAADPNVAFSEPNWIYNHTATANDPYYTSGSLWGMYGDATSPANAYGSQAGEAWASGKTGSNTVWIGIIDEGYMYSHEDLAANAGVNPGEIPGNKLDDDGNGFIDDVYGWDFDGNNNTVFDGSADDHGTHVAGTIGAAGGNGKGVAGICWNVKLINAKFLGNQGGTTANAIKALNYLTDLKVRHGINLVAINNSWGGGGYSQGLYDAIALADNADILFVAAAGNGGKDGVGDNNDTTPSYPASYTNANVISVAAIKASGAMSRFSNFGATSVHIGAPGEAIWSTIPKSSKGKIISSYASYSGTSMATPHVTGACGLYSASHPGVTAQDIKAAILSNAIPTASLAGKCTTGGRLNVSGF